MKVLLHLGNTPLKSVVTFMSYLGTYVKLKMTCEEAMKSIKNGCVFHGQSSYCVGEDSQTHLSVRHLPQLQKKNHF